VPAELPPPGSLPSAGAITDPSDSRVLQILTTEHWSVLATRSLGYNETFTRASIFFTAVTGSLIALAFVADASGFEAEFGWFAVLILIIDLVLGIGTLQRLSALTFDDFRQVQAMNRLRHAYLEVAPGAARYLMMSQYDDSAGVLKTYGGLPETSGLLPSLVHGLSTVTAAVGAVVALLVGGIVGMVVEQSDLGPALALLAGVAAFVIALAGLGLVARRSILRFTAMLDATAAFPTPARDPAS
jgi:hypothetical protein